MEECSRGIKNPSWTVKGREEEEIYGVLIKIHFGVEDLCSRCPLSYSAFMFKQGKGSDYSNTSLRNAVQMMFRDSPLPKLKSEISRQRGSTGIDREFRMS
ncbi:Hypothetical protein CINCED_3A002190 [Cinara cedri]|uniref:Uncharacterized protein n=1 Tax=Cinara cedri TaxID=506608 RepID=A0A5E4MX36_9HEMI|nr:Hypothetical protein CINCED_3A002190 [Cinara cedri]